MAEYIVYESELVEVTDYLGDAHRVYHHEMREPIVRCRDCKHSADGGTICTWFAGYADYPTEFEIAADVEPDGFCAWGERRTA